MKSKRDEVDEFFDAYPLATSDLARGLRKVVHRGLPEAVEMLDRADRVVGYGFGSGYADLICTVIPSKAA